MKKIVIMLCVLMFLMSLNAIDVNGNQSGTWTLANSPYNVNGEITVPAGSTLTIEAGVEVLFAGNFKITAEGRVIAIGTEESMITFRANTDSEEVTHKSFRLEYLGPEANEFDYCFFKNAKDAINSINSPVNITNSHFTCNDQAINIFAIGNDNPPLVLIENNLIENSVKSAILITESSAVTIHNNEITGNGTGPQFRGAIQVSIQTNNFPVEPTITHNNIHSNHYQGITCVDMFSCNGINAFISENIINNNYTGVYFYNCSGRLVDNVITNNFIPGDMNSGAGVMCYGGGATPYIAGNQISGNYGGVFITVGAIPVIGAPEMNHPYAYGLNTIENNIDVNDFNNSVVLNNLSSDITILAKNNFWGTTDIAEIESSITDSNDSATLGTVVYLPLAGEVSEYTLNLNITSDLEGITDYMIFVRDLATLSSTIHTCELGASTMIFNEPISFTVSGSFMLDGVTHHKHCYYGPFDEQTIVTLDDENQEATIELHFNAEPRPNTFRTYDYIDVNGLQVLPLLKDEFMTENVKQLVYENDNNEIMLVGYQKYGVTGWENVIFDEEVLYLKNDALPGETFMSHQVADFVLSDGQYSLYTNTVEITDIHDVNLTGSDAPVPAKAASVILESPYDMMVTTWIEFTGNDAPLSTNTREDSPSAFFAEDDNYTGTFNENKLLDLQPNVTVDYYTRVVLEVPTALTLINETLYWNPCSFNPNNLGYVTGYTVFWEREVNNETVVESLSLSYDLSVELSDLNLDYGDYTIWVVGDFEDNSQTEPSNQLNLSVVSNDNNNAEPFTRILGNYPNPFNPETTIFYNLEQASKVELIIYNIRGQKVRTLVNEPQGKGKHQIIWNGKDDKNQAVASGVYLYRMKNGKFSSSKKMILLK